MLELKNISKKVNQEDHILPTNLKFKSGEFNILLGPVSSGKTTLLRLIAGLETPSQGEIWLDEKNITNLSIQKRNIGMVYQQFINYSNWSVFENIASPLKVAKVNTSEINQRVNEIAQLLKLSNFLNRNVNELSGGQQQRTALARALVKNTKLVLLDEPLVNLDYKLREELRDEIPRLFKNLNVIIVYATTDPYEALLLEGNTVVLNKGEVVQNDKTISIYNQPKNLTVAKIFSDSPINIVEIIKTKEKIILNEKTKWEIPRYMKNIVDGKYYVVIRPHVIKLKPNIKKSITISGQVLLCEITGSETLIYFLVDDKEWTLQLHGVHPFKGHQKIKVFFDIEDCLFYDKEERIIQKKLK